MAHVGFFQLLQCSNEKHCYFSINWHEAKIGLFVKSISEKSKLGKCRISMVLRRELAFAVAIEINRYVKNDSLIHSPFRVPNPNLTRLTRCCARCSPPPFLLSSCFIQLTTFVNQKRWNCHPHSWKSIVVGSGVPADKFYVSSQIAQALRLSQFAPPHALAPRAVVLE